MATQYLKQADGRTVPQENGKPWPEAGMDTPITRYVRRRLASGDLVKATRPKKTAEKAATSGGK